MEEKIQKQSRVRAKRIPVGTRNRLEVVNKQPGFHYRVVNDVGARVQQFMDAGYEIVPTTEAYVALTRVDQVSPEGTANALAVGGGQRGFLMKIPKDFYDEDQKAKQQIIEQREAAIRKPEIDGAYGDIKLSSKVE
jgi:hypothetical protein